MPDPGADTTATKTGDDYVVVARRYRPQAFDELIGQGHVARALTQAITSGRVGHAYLFTGARGVGKTSAARIFAKALNCTSSDGPTPTPCNECDVCQSVSRGDDVDVLEIDGASNRGIDEIRQLRQNAGVRPSRARMKVYIIDEVHMLTKEAFNALLKTLEEPPEHVKFIFATTEPNKIPITILSRCQRFDFAGIESDSIRERLGQIAAAEGVAIDDEALQTISVRAAGSMRDSQSLLEQLLAVADGEITAGDVNSLLGIASAERVMGLAARLVERDAAGALAELDAALSGGADVGQLIDQLLGCFRDVMTLGVGCGPERLLYVLPAHAEGLKAISDRLGVQTVLAILQVLDQTAARLRLSVHGRTLAEMAVVRIAALEDLDDLAAVVAALKDGAELPDRPILATPAATVLPSAPPAPAQSVRPSPPPATQPVQREQPPAAERAVDPSPPAVAAPSRDEGRPAEEAPQSLGDADATSKGDPSPGLLEQFAQLSTAGPNGKTSAPRKSRRQLEAEAANKPFVQKAMELFEVEPGKLRYNPGEGG